MEKNINISWLEKTLFRAVHLLLFSAHLNYLMEENDDTMILPEEYIEMYEKPFDVTLESGEYIHSCAKPKQRSHLVVVFNTQSNPPKIRMS